ncbi:MAG: DUF4358 domain-containing protein [Ruminococcus sp.]|nr:DUF4358 domain-containing protein [Ruminococcus sp.]
MKKQFIAAAAALVLCVGGLASCGGSDSSSKSDAPAASSAAEAQADVTKDAAAIADKLKSDVVWKDQLNELESAMVEKIIGVKPDLYTAGKVYIGAGGATAEEIACFEGKDEAAADSIMEALNKRIEAQKKAFENYVPGELDKLGSAVLVKQGKYVFMCISDENDKAKEIIG